MNQKLVYRVTMDALLIGVFIGIVWIISTGGTKLELGGVTIGLRNPKNPSILFVLLLGIRIYFFGGSQNLRDRVRLREKAFTSLLYFLLSVLAVKTFVSMIATHHFHRVLDFEDWSHTYTPDFALGFNAAIVVLICTIALQYLKTPKIILIGCNLLLLFVNFALICVGSLYIALAYTYFEWGSFLEPQHFEAIRMAGVGPEFMDLFFRWRTLLVLLAGLSLYFLSKKLHIHIARFSPKGISAAFIVTAMLALTLNSATNVNQNPRKYAPSVQSPLRMLLKPISGNSLGLAAGHFAGISIDDFKSKAGGPIDVRYANLAGIAKGKNVIFFIMESVRRRNVDLYGYDRNTMPTLTELASTAIVFDQAYVMQPRSSKAMVALAFGVMPDPRLRPLAWDHERMFGHDSLINRLIDQGRKFYIGTAQPYGGDNLQRFFNASSNNRADRITAFEQLRVDPDLPDNDSGLSLDFLNWSKAIDHPFLSILWTECAHMPYATKKAPFGRVHLSDRYDNCLRQVDDALKTLVDGLASAGQLDDTLLLILGDHGEALGEKFDRGHGNYLFQHSLRVPFLIYNPKIFKNRIDVSARFQLKDVPSSLLYLLGESDEINQSVNIFSKGDKDQLYLSNVYQDFKLGMIKDQEKFIYRPTYDISYIYDLQADEEENLNIVNRYSKSELDKMKKEVLTWYRFQTKYLENKFPKKAPLVSEQNSN